jgi:hypothetical protein
MNEFTTGSDPDDTSIRWKKWKKEIETRLRYFRIENVQDKVDALNIYGGEVIRELADTLPDRPPVAGQPNRNDYEQIMAKLDHHFTPMANPDSARAKLDRMVQQDGETLAQFHVRIRLQAEKCQFPDKEDAIRSKLLLAMKDGRLRREAMVKRNALPELLEQAANKEDIDRQALVIEKESPDQQVHGVMQKKRNFSNPKTPRTYHKSTAKPHTTTTPNTPTPSSSGKECEFCGYTHHGHGHHALHLERSAINATGAAILLKSVSSTERVLNHKHMQCRTCHRNHRQSALNMFLKLIPHHQTAKQSGPTLWSRVSG